jgi:D-alanyl-D-alanine dipeptidase
LTREGSEPVLISDPRVLAVPIREGGEPLVDLREYPVLTDAENPRVKSTAETRLHCRQGVAERLVAANRALPGGARLLAVECHRPLAIQEHYWRVDLADLQEKHPDWPEERLLEENARFVAPPWIIPPHSTGGAVDLLLVDAEGRDLDMGSSLNEEGPLMRTGAQGIPPEAKENRRALLRAMESAGFVNYPHEWWHFSYGDRYWAYSTGAPAAVYGPA